MWLCWGKCVTGVALTIQKSRPSPVPGGPAAMFPSAPAHACLPDTKFSIGSHDSSSETINPNNSSINCLGHVISVPCHSNKKVTNPSTWEEKADGSL